MHFYLSIQSIGSLPTDWLGFVLTVIKCLLHFSELCYMLYIIFIIVLFYKVEEVRCAGLKTS